MFLRVTNDTKEKRKSAANWVIFHERRIREIGLAKINGYGGMPMAVGFVLVKTAQGHEHEVYDRLSKLSEIVELYTLSGDYDLITKINTNDFKKLGEMILSKIRSVKNVEETKTLIPLV